MTKQLTAVSFSRLKDYRTCPQKAWYKHGERMKEPGNAAMENGIKVHKLAEDFAGMSKKDKCPIELKKFEKHFRELQNTDVLVEERVAFNKDWVVASFFDKSVYVRVVWDASYKLTEQKMIIIDHKTGKIYPDHVEQLSLYALAGFLIEPEVEEVDVQLWYLDIGELTTKTYYRKDVAKLQKEWDKQFKPMTKDRSFRPTPGRHCGWCHFRRSNGGPCAH